MLSCKDVSHIVSESLDKQLPWHMRLKVWFHLSMCRACQQMVQQMELLRTTAGRCSSREGETVMTERETLSDEACSRILKHLQQAQNDFDEHE